MSEEIKQSRAMMRAELADWIEARIPEFLAQFSGEGPVLPVVEDFRLLICIGDGADPDSSTYYPVVNSGTSFHRQVGLVEQAAQFLAAPDDPSDD